MSKLNRRKFLRKITGTIALAALSPLLVNCHQESQKPNFVFILLDDFGWKDCGFMGSQYYETPNIDRLASEGMIFTSAYANAPNCAPSRACLLTGQYSPRHGIYTVNSSERGNTKLRKIIPTPNNITLPSEKITIAEELKSHGYTCASMGKWHMGNGKQTNPLGQGFDINIGGTHIGHPPAGYFEPYKLPNLEIAQPNEYLTDRLNNEALKFIENNRNNPFFLYLSHYAVHTPIQAKSEIIKKYVNKNPNNEQNNPEYAAMVESCDIGVGRILQKLKDLKIDNNTVVIFFSDNGGVAGITSQKPLRGGKGMLYEGGIRVPLAIKWSGKIKPNQKSTENVIGIDFYPTILEMANINPSSKKIIDGESLIPLLLNKKKLQREAIHFHFPAYLQGNLDMSGARDKYFRTRPGAAIISGDWKLIEYFENNDLELYNLKKDISESNNLTKSNPNKVTELYTMMKKWREKINAPVPTQQNPKYVPNFNSLILKK